jgi:hypothetical protein
MSVLGNPQYTLVCILVGCLQVELVARLGSCNINGQSYHTYLLEVKWSVSNIEGSHGQPKPTCCGAIMHGPWHCPARRLSGFGGTACGLNK